MKLLATVLMTLLLLLSSGCDHEEVANRGFSLPAGDTENGRSLFFEHKCTQCHTLAGAEFIDDADELTKDDGINVKLGGPTTKIQTYGDLVTSIINPSHRIAKGYPSNQVTENGESKMSYYNEVLTVVELIDLVTFLESKYELPDYSEAVYRHYVYPY